MKRITAKDVQRARADWYQFHFDNYRMVSAMPEDAQKVLRMLAALLPAPEMTVFGGVCVDWLTYEVLRRSHSHGVDANLINPWYLSAEGWAQFQALWSVLPEPVDLSTPPCVQLGELSTLSTIADLELPKR